MSAETKSSEQNAAEADVESFHNDLGPFVVAADTTRMAMVFTDAKEVGNPIIFANDSFLSLCGYSRDQVLARRFDFLVAPDADPQALAQIEAAFAGVSERGFEVRCRRKDGALFWAAVLINPVLDRAGAIVEH